MKLPCIEDEPDEKSLLWETGIKTTARRRRNKIVNRIENWKGLLAEKWEKAQLWITIQKYQCIAKSLKSSKEELGENRLWSQGVIFQTKYLVIEVLEDELKEAEEGQSNEILKLNFLSKREKFLSLLKLTKRTYKGG